MSLLLWILAVLRWVYTFLRLPEWVARQERQVVTAPSQRLLVDCLVGQESLR